MGMFNWIIKKDRKKLVGVRVSKVRGQHEEVIMYFNTMFPYYLHPKDSIVVEAVYEPEMENE